MQRHSSTESLPQEFQVHILEAVSCHRPHAALRAAVLVIATLTSASASAFLGGPVSPHIAAGRSLPAVAQPADSIRSCPADTAGNAAPAAPSILPAGRPQTGLPHQHISKRPQQECSQRKGCSWRQATS